MADICTLLPRAKELVEMLHGQVKMGIITDLKAKTMINSYCIAMLIAIMFFTTTVIADELETLSRYVNEVNKQTYQTESQQLEKARQAVKETKSRERVQRDKQHLNWQEEQYNKAQQQFEQREIREQKYLREAQQAATQERKLPKS